MAQQVPVGRGHVVGTTNADGTIELAPSLSYARLAIVNVLFAGRPGAGPWVLIDAGLVGTAGRIRRLAERRFGGAPPAAILLTHGHFDHVGALERLASDWDVPVYAHALERPYLDGSTSYPRPNPRAGGGLMARLSPLYGRGPVDVSARLRVWPADGSVPFMPGWRAIHTPGHSVGHLSLFEDATRTLIAGDAVVTVAQESAIAVAVQAPELHGPPRYFTPDWVAAARSARTLAALAPATLVTGHGRALGGPAMRQALDTLAQDFERLAPGSGETV